MGGRDRGGMGIEKGMGPRGVVGGGETGGAGMENGIEIGIGPKGVTGAAAGAGGRESGMGFRESGGIVKGGCCATSAFAKDTAMATKAKNSKPRIIFMGWE